MLFLTVLAFLLNTFVYFAFGNIYSSSILNYSAFQEQFSGGIYQYRILSVHVLLSIYDFLGTLNLDYSVFKLKFLNPVSEPRMFLAFYMLNTFFLVLTAVMMVLITESKKFAATASEKLLMATLSIFVIALSQFVIVPYDVSSYFFLLLFFWVLLKYLDNKSSGNLLLLTVILAVSTLNRESAALSISLAATLLISQYGLKKKTIIPVAALAGTFLTVYVVMRLMAGIFTTNDGSLLLQNFTQPKNILGLLFWITFFAFTLLISNGKEQTRNILVFHSLSAPYIVMCFYTGILYEARLYVPLFLTGLILAKISAGRAPGELLD
ncbi:hypothetical protein [Chryseobacterium taklimakanense]|uniref:Glycosyltransferase RgtA/B/C/D-like domain-containing protein n=1 Tax=Chryseobacterium taklimakanense TaxID=536441 RepID=A0A3G8WJ36_9FLAO|nr:hypothetical protein [Chryseobacterium taklimakanense]AZI21180.1 hypothetical protein EIH08_11190 [Chryseobacterium taklimakanense]